MEQEEHKLQVIVKAEELAIHTIRLTSNSKKFPKKFRHSICDRMQLKSLDIYENLMEANRINKIQNGKLKYKLQTRVILYCDELLFYIKMCIKLNLISVGSADYWSKLVSDVKYMTIAWRSKDK